MSGPSDRGVEPYDAGPPLVWWVGVRFCDLVVRLLGRVEVVGAGRIPRTGGALIAANHVSHVDPLVLLVVAHRAAGRKVRLMGVQEIHDKPVLGWWVRAGRHIPVTQGSSSRAPLEAAERALRAGELVLIYPEGTIARSGDGGAAKGGVGLLALRAGVPVVPLRSRGLEHGRVVRWRPWRRLRASVAVGEPVELPDVSGLRGSARYRAVGDAVLAAVRRL